MRSVHLIKGLLPCTQVWGSQIRVMGIMLFLFFSTATYSQTPKEPTPSHMTCSVRHNGETTGGECHSVGMFPFPAGYCDPKTVIHAYTSCGPTEGKAPCADWSCYNQLAEGGYTVYMSTDSKASAGCLLAAAAAAVACAKGPSPGCYLATAAVAHECGNTDACKVLECNEIPSTRRPLNMKSNCVAKCPDPPPPPSPK